VNVTPRARELEAFLHSQEPFESLRARVLERLTVDGLYREVVLGDLEDLRAALAKDGRVEDEELVMVLMDQLVGFCSPRSSLVRVGQSENDDPDADDVVLPS
jgi:hypothetical protein